MTSLRPNEATATRTCGKEMSWRKTAVGLARAKSAAVGLMVSSGWYRYFPNLQKSQGRIRLVRGAAGREGGEGGGEGRHVGDTDGEGGAPHQCLVIKHLSKSNATTTTSFSGSVGVGAAVFLSRGVWAVVSVVVDVSSAASSVKRWAPTPATDNHGRSVGGRWAEEYGSREREGESESDSERDSVTDTCNESPAYTRTDKHRPV